MSQDQLLLKLYDGALNFVRIARRGMEENNPKIKGENISKVIAIISELDCALDMETGGGIAENLSTLYQHIIFRLVEANIKKDISGLDEAESILTTIKDGFLEAAKINRASGQNVQRSQTMAIEQKGGMCLAI